MSGIGRSELTINFFPSISPKISFILVLFYESLRKIQKNNLHLHKYLLVFLHAISTTKIYFIRSCFLTDEAWFHLSG
jgi:hypothetical protein